MEELCGPMVSGNFFLFFQFHLHFAYGKNGKKLAERAEIASYSTGRNCPGPAQFVHKECKETLGAPTSIQTTLFTRLGAKESWLFSDAFDARKRQKGG
jgi:hypothetical protein